MSEDVKTTDSVPASAPSKPSTMPAPASAKETLGFHEGKNADAPPPGSHAADKHFENEHELDAKEPGHSFVRTCPSCGKLKQTYDATGGTPCRRCAHEAKHGKQPLRNAVVRLSAPEALGEQHEVSPNAVDPAGAARTTLNAPAAPARAQTPTDGESPAGVDVGAR